MKKETLAKEITRNSNCRYTQALRFVDDFFEVMAETLENNEEVHIQNFGKFLLKEKPERAGRNPRTLEKHVISARRVTAFRCSIALRKAVKCGI